jgi:hypothetical protein
MCVLHFLRLRFRNTHRQLPLNCSCHHTHLDSPPSLRIRHTLTRLISLSLFPACAGGVHQQIGFSYGDRCTCPLPHSWYTVRAGAPPFRYHYHPLPSPPPLHSIATQSIPSAVVKISLQLPQHILTLLASSPSMHTHCLARVNTRVVRSPECSLPSEAHKASPVRSARHEHCRRASTQAQNRGRNTAAGDKAMRVGGLVRLKSAWARGWERDRVEMCAWSLSVGGRAYALHLAIQSAACSTAPFCDISLCCMQSVGLTHMHVSRYDLRVCFAPRRRRSEQ